MKDLIILGNGMAGMTAALYASRAGLDFKIVSRDEYDFGQISDAILVDNYPCLSGKSGFDLASGLHDQLINNGIEIEEHEITNVSKYLDNSYKTYYKVTYTDGKEDYAKTIIYALGASHRKLNCSIDKNSHIHYCALCDGSLYKDKIVAVIGGGDSAFTQAEYLSKICKHVNIIMCDRNITAFPTTIERVKQIENLTIHYDSPITAISHRQIVGGADLEELYCNNDTSFWADGIFVAIGMIPNTRIVNIADIVNKDGYLIAEEDCQCTLSPGFFAAGDVRTKMVRQSITAAADGANAVQSVIRYLKEGINGNLS